MTNATCYVAPSFSGPLHPQHVQLVQNLLIRFVRHHPSLRWLKSDLTDENIAMLKAEGTQVTLVNKLCNAQ